MALGIPLYILLNAIVSLSKETTVTVSTPITSQQSNWTVNKTEAEYTEGLIALKFSHPCLADHHSYCINGICVFHHELKKAICRCTTGYTGERCEHLTLNSYAVDSYEKYIAVGIGVGLLLSLFLALIYCYVRKRCMKLKPPYKVCSGGKRPL
ncbi:epigen isoform X3 [Petaurus breviceps papuanus]|uniref:epigen isoform X3 n=1 Tax=Petaurus breviceps papuanus TaxID=3040969 RepID=UPI0036D9613A